MSTARPYESPLRAEQLEQTRLRILKAMADVLADEAVDEVTIPIVAMRARVSVRTVYRHFPTKEALFDAFGEWAEEHIVPARFRLRSRVVKVGGATLVGAVGECEYRILRPEALEARVAAMLAAYSHYCGSGQKTTMGLGSTEPLTS